MDNETKQQTVSNPLEHVVMLPCKVCGGTAEMAWGGVTEFYGKAEQDLTIDCENDAVHQHHGFTVSITTDSNGAVNCKVTEKAAINAWNALNLV
jgi:hypothetical protein